MELVFNTYDLHIHNHLSMRIITFEYFRNPLFSLGAAPLTPLSTPMARRPRWAEGGILGILGTISYYARTGEFPGLAQILKIRAPRLILILCRFGQLF
jgi:hypothetical protein